MRPARRASIGGEVKLSMGEDAEAGVRFGSARGSELTDDVTIEYVTDMRGFGTGSLRLITVRAPM
jgi:hypothetical protein